MQLANCLVAIGGDKGNTVPKQNVTPAEILILRDIHTNEGVFDVVPLNQDLRRSSAAERLRLIETYGRVDPDTGRRISASVEKYFPGVGSVLPQSMAELTPYLREEGVPENFYKSVARAGEIPAQTKDEDRKNDEIVEKSFDAPATVESAAGDEIQPMDDGDDLLG